MFYCNISTPSTSKILYIDRIKTAGRENIEAATVADFNRIIAERQPAAIMFGFYGFPQRPVDVSHPKLQAHLRRLVRSWSK